MNLPVTQKHFLSFSRKLFLSVISLFLVFAICFIAYQYQREREYKIELLKTKLQDYNSRLYEQLEEHPLDSEIISGYINKHILEDLRVTLIDAEGNVVYDSYPNHNNQIENHLNRPEVQKAIKHGNGYDVRRTSETTGVPYFYSATRYKDYIVRSALPYNVSLINNLQAKDKKEILVNNLFTQYSNLISDSNLETTEEVFAINELKEIIHFINKNQQERSRGKGEKRMSVTINKNGRTFIVECIIFQDASFEISINDVTQGKGEKRMSVTINKNGRTFIVECIIFQDASFEISINDVTQEEEQVRLKRQLTQNIAHELKTPVSSIQGYLETIVSNENIPREKINVFLERCYAQSNRLSRLLRDISVLTRMDEAASMIDMERVDISVLVGNIINEVSLELDEKHITVINSLKKSIQVKGNYSLLYSIFRNLMDNAIAYAGSNIQININCFREDENFYYFSFADTGIGVSPEHLNRLFERFYRVDKGRSRKLGGTGLGLAIVKNAVIIHGGNISAKNNQGGGLEFVFTLAKEK